MPASTRSGTACESAIISRSAPRCAVSETPVWVGAGADITPFVLDRNTNFYTWRNWQHETRLAQAIRVRAAERTLPVAAADLATDLALLFAGEDVGATHWQRVAVAAVPGSRLFVLTGGPGTGKTTTAVRLLLMLLRHARACGLPAQPCIALAAPTGKAAQEVLSPLEGINRLLYLETDIRVEPLNQQRRSRNA